MTVLAPGAVETAISRLEGREKVTGAAKYAYEHAPDLVAYATVVSSTIAKGAVRSIDAEAALALPGVLAVLSHENAPNLAEAGHAELEILQSPRVSYRGQIVAAVVADSLETARQAERLVRVEYDEEQHNVVLSRDFPGLYTPEVVNPTFPSTSEEGDPEGAFAGADVTVDCTYETPAFHNNPMEPHATLAVWEGDSLVVYDATQGPTSAKQEIARAFGLRADDVRVIAPHVGGGFGSKGTIRPQVILAVMAARAVGRPVKVAVTRQQMFAFTGYRTPTIQRVRLAADEEGNLQSILHDVVEQTSTIEEFGEQTAVATRIMYAAPNRRTSHRLAPLDVPTPSWMRAPGETPGMYALESAMDELAYACRLDPVELRIRNEPERDPESGLEFSSRNLVACLREGAERFGWWERDPTPRSRSDGSWLVGTGVASSTYPAYRRPSQCAVRHDGDGAYVVSLAASDVGTGGRTVLTQIAAEALDVPLDAVRLELGDSSLPDAPLAGGSMGTAAWGTAIVKACRELRERGGDGEVRVDTTEDVQSQEPYARHAFGAQFAEVRVDVATGEVRVSRLLGVFAAGRIMNAKLARSQFIGGMTMGLSMALHEESIIDPRFGDYVNHDFASYHIASAADVEEIDAIWVDEEDPHLNPMGSKGIGEIGIVGTAAAIGNAVHHATGFRIRDLPLHPSKLISLGAAGHV